MFKLPDYIEPDFSEERFVSAPNARLEAAPVDKAAPRNFHAMSIFPEYFKIEGKWYLAEESRMDCVPVFEKGRIHVREFTQSAAGRHGGHRTHRKLRGRNIRSCQLL